MLQISDEFPICTSIVRREHPSDQSAEPTGANDGAQQSILPIVVDIPEILVLHGALLSIEIVFRIRMSLSCMADAQVQRLLHETRTSA